MKEKIKDIVQNILDNYLLENSFEERVNFDVEIPKNEKFGDFSTNVAMILAKKLKSNPRNIANEFIKMLEIQNNNLFRKIEIAGPGFINFHVNKDSFVDNLCQIFSDNEKWGSSNFGNNKKVLIEFVSANPTGYLHFGHARNAAVGDSIARIFSFLGFDVTKEFYINDAGRQMELLAISVFTRYKQLFGSNEEIPEDGYQGEYIKEIANEIKKLKGNELIEIVENEAITFCKDFAYRKLLDQIKSDLLEARVEFDFWYSEKENIHYPENGISKISTLREKLDSKNALYSKDNALWFNAKEYGDNQDWVLLKSDGQPTYFFADIAYHNDKIERGFDRLINIWGADHHSHVSRLKSSLKALIDEDSILDVLLIQFVRLIKDGKEVSMSKREGSFVTLREVIDEVGCDVTRFFLLMRSSDSHLDFDLDLAKNQSSDNPVYYIQYAHARIESVMTKAKEEQISISDQFLNSLVLDEEIGIIKKLLEFPEIVRSCALTLSPHKLAFFLQELASDFHVYYNKNKILNEDFNLSSARLYLIRCIQIVIKNGLNLLGVNSPRRM